MLPSRRCGFEDQLTEWDDWNPFGERGASKYRTDEVVGDRLTDGPPDQIHLANEFDTLLGLFIQLKNEAKDIACIDEGGNNDISGVRYLVIEDHMCDPRLNELNRSVILRRGEQIRLPRGTGQRPVIALVVIQNL